MLAKQIPLRLTNFETNFSSQFIEKIQILYNGEFDPGSG